MNAARDQSQVTCASQHDWDLLVLYVDLYKHHLDLFVKAYLLWIAILGATAGFVFGEGVGDSNKFALLFFATAISVVGIGAWSAGLAWSVRMSRQFLRVSEKVGVPPIPIMFGVKAILWAAITSAVIMAGAGIWLLWL